ncbi:hypothetical protein LTR08_008272 [Meristemomyces frigidus]|nr:hypothetical protein LTR08_008272 [Meristemomyces frigidus]
MAFPLGVFTVAADTAESSPSLSGFRSKKAQKEPPPKSAGTESSGNHSSKKPAPASKQQDQIPWKTWRPAKKHKKSLSAIALATNRRTDTDLHPPRVLPDREKSSSGSEPKPRPLSTAKAEVFELADTSPRGASTTRPKHIPIVIPNYVPLARGHIEARSASFSTLLSNGSDSTCISDPPLTPRDAAGGPGYTTAKAGAERPKPKHVEIQIPDWAQPLVKQSNRAPRLKLSQSTFLDPFTDTGVAALSSYNMSRPNPDLSWTNSMSSTMSTSSPTQMYANQSNGGSRSHLASMNSSHSSLVGLREEYESASEADSGQDESGSGSHTPSQSAAPSPAPGQVAGTRTPSGSNTANLSGLVCNVHRTTGKEPHPLVGATTTVLGDKLYVFGGRRLSRTKPQLTSHLYELDLIRRHWTKLEVNGDVPPARYFHSVCPLGDTKLVCYGGMSPAPTSDAVPDAQQEVVVMSDIHIYDVLTKTWLKVSTADSPQGRYAHCAAILPSSAVFASSSAPMSAVHHNPSGSDPNAGQLGVSLDGTGGAEMVVVGGQDSANHYIEQVSIFNLRSLKWTGTSGMGRSCGAYRSVVTPLTSMSALQIGAGPHARADVDDEDEEPAIIGSGAPMLIYSNYNFLDVKLELQVRLTDGTLTEKPMQTGVSPPGLRFPNGGVIDNHFVVSGTFLTSSKQEYALWALDLRTLAWSRIDAGGSIFSQGSWNRGVLWSRRNSFVILGNRKRSLVDDYNNRRINFTNICVVELEAFGLYDNPRRAEPTSAYASASVAVPQPYHDTAACGRQLSHAAEELGKLALGVRELADMDFLAIDGTRIPVNSRLIARRWGHQFTSLLRESLALASDADTATLRASVASHPSRNSSVTITPSLTSSATALTSITRSDLPDARSAPPSARSRLFYLPHTALTLQALLHYLYTSKLAPPPSHLATPQILCSLLQLARPYRIDGLLEAVVERLHESLDGRNAAAIFNAAAMGAGGGESVQFASSNGTNRDSIFPVRIASLAGMDGFTMNGPTRGAASLRIDTDMANGRTTRNTIRPGQQGGLADESSADEDDVPSSAATDRSMTESEMSLSARSMTGRGQDREIWSGALSAVVGLQKRGLRGLMEGRRMRERSDGMESTRVGLGIA